MEKQRQPMSSTPGCNNFEVGLETLVAMAGTSKETMRAVARVRNWGVGAEMARLGIQELLEQMSEYTRVVRKANWAAFRKTIIKIVVRTRDLDMSDKTIKVQCTNGDMLRIRQAMTPKAIRYGPLRRTLRDLKNRGVLQELEEKDRVRSRARVPRPTNTLF